MNQSDFEAQKKNLQEKIVSAEEEAHITMDMSDVEKLNKELEALEARYAAVSQQAEAGPTESQEQQIADMGGSTEELDSRLQESTQAAKEVKENLVTNKEVQARQLAAMHLFSIDGSGGSTAHSKQSQIEINKEKLNQINIQDYQQFESVLLFEKDLKLKNAQKKYDGPFKIMTTGPGYLPVGSEEYSAYMQKTQKKREEELAKNIDQIEAWYNGNLAKGKLTFEGQENTK